MIPSPPIRGEQARRTELQLGCSQYHLAVAGGCAALNQSSTRLHTHPLPRGGTDYIQAGYDTEKRGE